MEEKIDLSKMPFREALKLAKQNPNIKGAKEIITQDVELKKGIQFFTKNIQNLSKNIAVGFGNYIQTLQDFHLKVDSGLLSLTKEMSKRGWYLSPEALNGLEISDIIDGISLTRFENKLVEDSTNFLPNLIKTLSDQFPKRKSILCEIERSFRQDMYSSVICLSYTQADGICNEAWGIGCFDKDKNRSYELKVFRKLENMELGFISIFAQQLNIEDKNEITMHSCCDELKNEQKRKNSFNRHLILHGHSIGYGTKTNAVRALYLLDFLDYFINKRFN